MGLSFLIASLCILFILKNSHQLILGILIPSLVILFFGIVDDIKELSVWQKLLVQAVAVTLLILLGIRTKIIYIGYAANIIITSLWVIGITNAFNHLDIIDGLAGGTAVIISLAFFIVAVFSKNAAVIFLSLALMGILFSFLARNFPPAKVYMGNSGSHFLGFVLSAVALVLSYAPLERKIALLSPIFILGFPIFDTAFVILMRIGKGRPAVIKSNDHLALRFLKKGYSQNKTLWLMLALAAFFALCGVLLSRLSGFWGYLVICVAFLVSFVLTIRMSRVLVD